MQPSFRSLVVVWAALVACGGSAPPSPAASSGTRDAVASESDALRHARAPRITPQTSGTTNGLIGISAVSSHVAWASGRNGTFLVTTDGGRTWRSGVVPGAETLQFRDVEAFSDRVAYLLSIGTGLDSRIYKTVDGGAHWTLEFQNANPDAFYDCLAFWDERSGLTMADSVAGRFPIVRTLDGRTWQDIGDRLPPALPGEAGFASSGTCAATFGHRRAWLTTGGTDTARVLSTRDRGRTWTAATAPIAAGPSGGGFSIAFRDARHGILGGGDLAATGVVPNVATSRDGGRTWTLATSAPIPGAIYGLAYALPRGGHGHDGRDDDDEDDDRAATAGPEWGRRSGRAPAVVATAPTGTAWSPDEGRSWTVLPGLTGYWAVDFADGRTGWLVGADGEIARIDL